MAEGLEHFGGGEGAVTVHPQAKTLTLLHPRYLDYNHKVKINLKAKEEKALSFSTVNVS